MLTICGRVLYKCIRIRAVFAIFTKFCCWMATYPDMPGPPTGLGTDFNVRSRYTNRPTPKGHMAHCYRLCVRVCAGGEGVLPGKTRFGRLLLVVDVRCRAEPKCKYQSHAYVDLTSYFFPSTFVFADESNELSTSLSAAATLSLSRDFSTRNELVGGV